MEEVKARGERVIRRDVLANMHHLNPRQMLALELLLEKGAARIEDVEELCPGVHRRTLQRDLQGLVEKGLAKSEGSARATHYVLGGGVR